MKRLEISVPDMNDSFSRIALDGKQYLIRFTYNDTADRWSFGLYTIQKEPLVVGMRIVPQFPLNIQFANYGLPPGVFGVYTDLLAVGRKDFVNGKAVFAYISNNQD